MSSEIWKIGQETNAKTMYDNINEKGVNGCRIIRGEVAAVKHLTAICKSMSDAYDEVVDDQNEYLFEIEGELNRVEDLKEEIEEKIKQLFSEIKTLEQKEKNGTITEEEKEELGTKKDELNSYMQDADNKLNEKTDKITAENGKKANAHSSKQAIAKDYAETTIEKGTPLAETQVKTKSFWRSIFGGTGEKKKIAGEEALKAGNELLDKVGISEEINSKVEKDIKQINSKQK